MHHEPLWAAYIFGAVLTLGFKIAHFLYEQNKLKVSFKGALTDFFFGNPQAGTSTVATVGVVWVMGGLYIDRIEFIFGSMLSAVPLHVSIAFFLGSIAEMGASTTVQFTLKKIFPGKD